MARRATRRSTPKPRRAVSRSSARSRAPVRARRSARANSGRGSPTTVRVVIQQSPAPVASNVGAVSMDTLKKARF